MLSRNCDAMKKVLLEKNRRYGNAALNPLSIFHKGNNMEGIKVRLDDKLSRVKNSDKLRANDICDIIGYCYLLLLGMGVTPEEIEGLID